MKTSEKLRRAYSVWGNRGTPPHILSVGTDEIFPCLEQQLDIPAVRPVD
jgi:hypothetical protein